MNLGTLTLERSGTQVNVVADLISETVDLDVSGGFSGEGGGFAELPPAQARELAQWLNDAADYIEKP